jgi:hypothetical protein
MSKRKIAGTIADATLPKTPVEVNGKTYYLCFTVGALSEAETAINRELGLVGTENEVNLLQALPKQNLANTRLVFAAAVRAFHPELTFDEAAELLEVPDLYPVAVAIREAWARARVQPKDDEGEGRPIEAAAAVA